MDYSSLQKLDFLGLMPCPLKVPFEELLINYVQHSQEKNGSALQCLIESNANNQINFFSWLKNCQDIDELPHIMMAPGFSRFFYQSFRKKFIEQGFFRAVGSWKSNPALLELQDPERIYTIPTFNPTVMVVDRTNHPEVPLPRCWQDLLEPEYEGRIALRGHQDSNFCEGVFLNIYKERGEEGIRRLGKATKIGLHPSQMVKLAGSGKPEAPAVSAIPYSFARLIRPSEHVSVIWPEDGAIVNPVVLMVKAQSLPKIEHLAELIASQEVGRIFADASFPSCHPQVDNGLPPEARFKWLGWDFLKENDIEELISRIEAIFFRVYLEDK